MNPFPEEWELLSFFECEPELDDDTPWYYNRLTFRTQRGKDVLTAKIEPSYERLSLLWKRDDVELVCVEFNWVSSLTIETGSSTEILTACFLDGHLSPFKLHLKPSIHISFGTSHKLP